MMIRGVKFICVCRDVGDVPYNIFIRTKYIQIFFDYLYYGSER